jgi:hypothetical protein
MEGLTLADVAEQTFTQEELMAKLQAASAAKDITEVMRIASLMKKGLKGTEDKELEAKKAQITDLTQAVKVDVLNLIEKHGSNITSLVGAKRAIINVAWAADGQTDPVVKIVKGGGSGGKRVVSGAVHKFDKSTEELLTEYGGAIYKDTTTYQEAWTAADKDKNQRFAVRKALIKQYNKDHETA